MADGMKLELEDHRIINQGANVLFGMEVNSTARVIDMEKRFVAFESKIGVYALELTATLAERLKEAIRTNFAPHDRTGDPDPHQDLSTQYENYVHTIDTLEVHVEGYHAQVSIAGAAALIEWGTPEHSVTPRRDGPGVMHWNVMGMDYFSMGHSVKGITADDFMGRAMHDVELQGMLKALFSESFFESFMEPTGWHAPIFVGFK